MKNEKKNNKQVNPIQLITQTPMVAKINVEFVGMGINRWREWDCSRPRPVAIFHLGGSRTERELRVDRNAIAHMEDLEGSVPTRELQSVFIGSSRTKKHLYTENLLGSRVFILKKGLLFILERTYTFISMSRYSMSKISICNSVYMLIEVLKKKKLSF